MSDQDWARALGSTMERRTTELDAAGNLTTDDVTGRARRIRGRRRAVVAGAVAAVLAVAVPLTVLGRGDDRAAPDPADTPLPIRIGYTANGVHHAPDGTTTELPTDQVLTVAPGSHGLLQVTSPSASGLALTTVTSDGSVVGLRCTSGPPVVSPDGEVTAHIAYVCDDPSYNGRLGVIGSDFQYELPVVGRVVLLGVSDDGTVTGVDDDGSVISSDPDGRTRVLAKDVAPILFDAAHERLAVIAGSGARAETRLLDVSGDQPRVLWTARGEYPYVFSPDGDVLVTSRGEDGRLRDSRTGRVMTTLGGGDGGAMDGLVNLAWETPRSLLSVRPQGETGGQVVRVALDGTVTEVADLPPAEPSEEPDPSASGVEVSGGVVFDSEAGSVTVALAQLAAGPSTLTVTGPSGEATTVPVD